MKNLFIISGTILLLTTIFLIDCEEILTPAILTTSEISEISYTTSTTGGNVTSDEGGIVTARGVCWSTTPNPTIADSKTTDGSGTGIFKSLLTGLQALTTYYVRAYASNSSVTAYGNEISFVTLNLNLTSDIDGNVYNIKTIGTQLWMAENLKTTKYNDGTSIPLVTDNVAWTALTTPAYSWYNNDAPTYKAAYGALYNWYAVGTGKLCPNGWHVPLDVELKTLTSFLGGENVAGGKLKETGTTHWQTPNNGATNTSAFTALPGGYKQSSFGGIGIGAYFWSASDYSSAIVWYLSLSHTSSGYVRSVLDKKNGLSVRCIKD